MSSDMNETFFFSLMKRYYAKYSKQPSAKTMFKIKNKLVPLAIEFYEREKCSYDDALELVLSDLESDEIKEEEK